MQAAGEAEVQKWQLDTDDQGQARQPIKAAEPGQYRLSYTVTDAKGHAIEGGYVFVIRGAGFHRQGVPLQRHRIVADKKEYAAGDTVKLKVNTNRDDAHRAAVRPPGQRHLSAAEGASASTARARSRRSAW